MAFADLRTESLAALYLSGEQQLRLGREVLEAGGHAYFRSERAQADRDAKLHAPGVDLLVEPYETALQRAPFRQRDEMRRYDNEKFIVNQVGESILRLRIATRLHLGIPKAESSLRDSVAELDSFLGSLHKELSGRLTNSQTRSVAEAHLVFGVDPLSATTSDLARGLLTADVTRRMETPTPPAGPTFEL